MEDIRWKQRLSSFQKILADLREICARRLDHRLDKFELLAVFKAFELCFEMAWNLLKDFLAYQGVTDVLGSRDAIRSAQRIGLLEDGSEWLAMITTRNLTAHTYNEGVVRELVETVAVRYVPAFEQLESRMTELASR